MFQFKNSESSNSKYSIFVLKDISNRNGGTNPSGGRGTLQSAAGHTVRVHMTPRPA